MLGSVRKTMKPFRDVIYIQSLKNCITRTTVRLLITVSPFEVQMPNI